MSLYSIPEPHIDSSLSADDIVNNFKDFNAYSGIVAGLTEAIAYERGELVEGVVVKKMTLPEKNGTTEELRPNSTVEPIATDKKSAEIDWGPPRGEEVW